VVLEWKRVPEKGCVGGGIIHFYGTYDFCVELQNILSEVYDDGDILRWHADDGIGIVSMETAMTVLDTYLSTGADRGITLNAKKTVVMLPHFTDSEEREKSIRNYLERGLLQSNILVNPRDFPMGSEQRATVELVYGVKYLGIYIGSDKFISASLESVLRKLESQADEIMAYAVGNGHRAFHLLQKSFSKKFCYHQRMTNPGIIGPFNLRFSNLLRKVVEHIIGFKISDVTWLQMRLKKKHGGCDLGVQDDIAWASFVSSFEESIGSVVELLPNIFPVGEVDQLYVDACHMAPSVRWYTQLKDQIISLSPDHQQKLREIKNLQHTYSVEMEKTRIADLVNELRADPERMMDLVRFTNLQNYHSSAWMDLSLTSKYNTFTNLELQSALAFYICETIPLLPGKCNCKSKDHIDPFGNHTIIRRPKGARREDMTV
jgi:hypothetical protein